MVASQLKLCIAVYFLLCLKITCARGRALFSEAPIAEVADVTTSIWTGKELAEGLKAAEAIGNLNEALDSLSTAIIYYITEKRGSDATALISDAIYVLESTNDTQLANKTSKAFGSSIQQTFFDPVYIIASSDVANAVSPAITSGPQTLIQATMEALKDVAAEQDNCTELEAVMTKAKAEAARQGKEAVFIDVLKDYKEAAMEDDDTAQLVQCASGAFNGL